MAFSKTALFLITISLSLTTPVNCQSSVLPSFTTQPTGGAVKDGNPYSLTCTLSSSSYRDITIIWLLNETPIAKQAHKLSGNTLSIASFGVGNNGNYTCVASISKWSLRSITVLVQVAYVTSPYNGGMTTITKKKNEAFAIDCIPGYNAYPMDKLKWEWYLVLGPNFIGTDKGDNSELETRDRLNILRLISPRTYECRIRSQVDLSQVVTYRTTIEVKGEASFEEISIITKPEDPIVVNPGEDVYLYCVPGGTDASITWTSNDESD